MADTALASPPDTSADQIGEVLKQIAATLNAPPPTLPEPQPLTVAQRLSHAFAGAFDPNYFEKVVMPLLAERNPTSRALAQQALTEKHTETKLKTLQTLLGGLQTQESAKERQQNAEESLRLRQEAANERSDALRREQEDLATAGMIAAGDLEGLVNRAQPAIKGLEGLPNDAQARSLKEQIQSYIISVHAQTQALQNPEEGIAPGMGKQATAQLQASGRRLEGLLNDANSLLAQRAAFAQKLQLKGAGSESIPSTIKRSLARLNAYDMFNKKVVDLLDKGINGYTALPLTTNRADFVAMLGNANGILKDNDLLNLGAALTGGEINIAGTGFMHAFDPPSVLRGKIHANQTLARTIRTSILKEYGIDPLTTGDVGVELPPGVGTAEQVRAERDQLLQKGWKVLHDNDDGTVEMLDPNGRPATIDGL